MRRDAMMRADAVGRRSPTVVARTNQHSARVLASEARPAVDRRSLVRRPAADAANNNNDFDSAPKSAAVVPPATSGVADELVPHVGAGR
jgi:hypothetical protein